jgi:hypothetical protein
MPVPAGNNDMTLGRLLFDVTSIQTLEDAIEAIGKLQAMLIGGGYPSPAKSGDTPYQWVYYAGGNFYGGKPSDPTNPDLLLSAAGGTVIVQEEGTPLASPTGTLNFIGASVTAVLNGAVADITVVGGSSNSFETITTDVSGPIVADSATDTANFLGGDGIVTTATAGTDTITWDADIDEDKGLEFVAAKIAANIGAGLVFDDLGAIAALSGNMQIGMVVNSISAATMDGSLYTVNPGTTADAVHLLKWNAGLSALEPMLDDSNDELICIGVNVRKTEIVATASEPLVVVGMLSGSIATAAEALNAVFIIPADDDRSLPGFDDTKVQLRGHDASTSAFKLETIAYWLKKLAAWTLGNDQSIGHDADDEPEWQDDENTCPE